MYKIVGGDQREYGPATSDQVREWIKTGRANAQTLATFEGSPWKPLSSFPEFADALRVAAPPPLTQAPGAYPGQPGQAYMGAETNNLAIAGLVMSILYCCFPLPLVGLVLSAIAYNQINKDPQRYTTSKLVPILGITFGAISLILFIIGIASGAMSEALRGFQR